MANLISHTNLRVLELLWLGIVSLLPCELLGETIPQPDVEINYLIPACDINFTTCQKLFDFMVSMHEGPSIVSHLTFQDSTNNFTNWTFWQIIEVSSLVMMLLSLWAHNNFLVAATN